MGILYIVPTPVGNMEDMTLRAIRILKEADLVLAEDTRTSSVLLKHFDIKNHLQAHHKFNEHGTTLRVIEKLKAGQTVALISDAGTRDSILPVKQRKRVLLCRHCRVQRLAFLLSYHQDYLVTDFVLKDSCLKRKAEPPIWNL